MLDNDIGLSVFSPSIVSAEAKPSTASRLPLEQLHENKIPEIPFFTLNKPTKFTAFTRKRGRDESQSSASVTPSAPSQVEPPSKKIVSTKSVSVLAPNIGISVDEIKMAPSHPSPETAVRRFQKLPQVETPVESPFPPNLPKYDETPILAKTLPVKRKTPQTVAFLVQETPTESPVQPIILIPNSLMNSMTPPTRRSNNGVEKTPFFSEKRNRIAERKTPDFSTQAVLSYEALDADEFTQLHPSVAASVESPEAKIELGPPLENPALTALILSDPKHAIPKAVYSMYKQIGLSQMYEWQSKLLMEIGDRNSHLFYAPTSAGKSFGAEIAILRAFLSQRKSLLILPFVSICSEKEKHLSRILTPIGCKVGGFYGGRSGDRKKYDVIISTMEKANSIVNKLAEEDNMAAFGLIVVDELHMIGDVSRGYILELLLTKLRYKTGDDVQIIGMSATIPNLPVLGKWLGATTSSTDFRPVPLANYIVCQGKVLDEDGNFVRTLEGYESHPEDPDRLVPLCWEAQGGVIIFVASKDGCEKCAMMLSKMYNTDSTPECIEKRKDVVHALKRTPGGSSLALQSAVQKGIAWHHAGLTMEERDLVENAFRDRIISVLCATSTLASGVNLPAKRVIFRSPMVGRDLLDGMTYQQMRGRAGRKGLDTLGESYLLCKTGELERVKKLVRETLPPITSCLSKAKKGMTRLILEIIVGGICTCSTQIQRYLKHTLLSATEGYDTALNAAQSALQLLIDSGFIEVEGSAVIADATGSYKMTKLGEAVVASGLAPEEGRVVYRELHKAMRSFVLANDLHIIYLITPIHVHIDPDWQRYYDIYLQLDESFKAVALIIGIREVFLGKASSGQISHTQRDVISIHRRFWAALLLHDLVQEVPFEKIMIRYNVQRGTLQALQQSSSSFAGMVNTFCERLKWRNLKVLVEDYQERLDLGIAPELCIIARLPHVKGPRARALWNAGYRTISDLACAEYEDLYGLFIKSLPFEENDDRTKTIESRCAENIIKAAIAEIAREREELGQKIVEIDHIVAKPVAQHVLKAWAPTPIPLTTAIKKRKSTEVDAESSEDEIAIDEAVHRIASQKVHKVKDTTLRNTPVKSLSLLQENHQIIDTLEQWHEISAKLLSGTIIACHLQTAYDNDEIKPVGLALCCNHYEVYFVDMIKLSDQRDLILKAIYCNARIFKVISDAKNQLKSLYALGIYPEDPVIDPMVAEWLLSPDFASSSTLANMMANYLPSYHSKMEGLSNFLHELCMEVLRSYLLISYFQLKLKNNKLWNHFIEVEMPMIRLLAKKEIIGVGFDPDCFSTLCTKFENELQRLEDEAYTLAGRAFRLTAPEQVAEILFDVLRLEPPGRKVSGRNERSTKKEVLASLRDTHELPSIITKHRRLYLILSKHLAPFQALKVFSDGYNMYRLYPTYETRTLTGRIMTNDPNLQCVPNPLTADTFETTTDVKDDTIVLRDAFRASHDHILISADFHQLELRIIAHLSGDEILIGAFKQKQDIFLSMASQWFNTPYAEVDPMQRKKAKTVCYAILYGSGPKKVADELDLTVEEAVEVMEGFRDRYPAITVFLKQCISKAIDTGYVQTINGRRRYIPTIHDSSEQVVRAAERIAVNTTVQGSASDLVKQIMLAMMNNVRKVWGPVAGVAFNEEKLKDRPEMILQIHDELLFEVPLRMEQDFTVLMRKAMELHITLRVPLPVRIKRGPSWGRMVDIK